MNLPTNSNPPVFDQYSRYYDLLYQNKDYASEAKFVSRQLAAYGQKGTAILELGCGTGRHAVEFARLGHQITGVDLSETMVQKAIERVAQSSFDQSRRPEFKSGDVRSVRIGEYFGAAISLFHVMSYQTTNEDLCSAFKTAADHLQPGGLLLFDFWYGPGVLSDPPVVRIKRLSDESVDVTRLAEPDFASEKNQVIVKYEVLIKEKNTGSYSKIQESHTMRYWFLPELKQCLKQSSFDFLSSGSDYSENPLTLQSWYGWVVARKRG